jgi:hypothetical protein
VKLPETFAGVQVLAQNQARQGGQRGGGQQNQGVGGGMGGGGMGGGGMGGMFNVPPERVAEINKVPTVCLDHGKGEPRPKMKYEIRPIEEVTDKPAVAELCRMLGTGTVNQRAAQVATWHLNNDMSWEQLAAKKLRFADGSSRPYFTPAEVQAGMQLVAQAQNLAEQRTSSSLSSAQPVKP